MEDMSQKIQELLNDEESMRQINELAQMFSSSEQEADTGSSENSRTDVNGDAPTFDPSKLLMLQGIMNSAGGGKNTALLLALKPLLKDERRARVDKAVKILKIISVLEMLKENGMLNDFFGGI